MSKLSRPKLIGAAALFIAFGAGYALAAQPHMTAALSDLRTARHQLNEAIPDKGGHRVKAISLIDEAIGEVQAGITAGAH